MDVFEAMDTCRAVRFFKPDPVPDEAIDKILHAATRAPSPGNSQGWDFIIVTDPGIKAQLSKTISGVIGEVVKGLEEAAGGMDAMEPVERRMLEGTINLSATLGEVPVIIIVCGRAIYPAAAPSVDMVWSALYPAAQNILLAARALGIGTCFTTYQSTCEAQLRALLSIPEDVYIAAFIPLGYPDTSKANFGPLARKPVESFVHRNGW